MANTVDQLYQEHIASPSAESLNALMAGVRAQALRMTRDDDAAQGVSIAVFTKLDGFVPIDDSAFSRWVAKISRIERKAVVRNRPDHDEFDEAVIVSESARFADLSGLAGFEQTVANDLLQGYSLREIATRVGLTGAALRKRLQRFRAKTQVPVTKPDAADVYI